MLFPSMGMPQNVNANQNQQIINVNVPTIEKKVYIDRYRTVYVEKPRVARKLEKPVLLLGYLWVYPEDLGNFKQIPTGVIKSINSQKPWGRDNWRIPTPDELSVLEANAEKIGLGNDIYLATDHRNGVLRLVAVEGEHPNCIKVGNTYWMKTNLGAQRVGEQGSVVSYEDAVRFCPVGFRLPTVGEYKELLAVGNVYFQEVQGESNAELYFPVRQTKTFYQNETYRVSGDYFIKGDDYYLYFGRYCDAGYWTTEKPKIISGSVSKGFARYVLDR